MTDRQGCDIAVLGASGVTGREIVRYLTRRAAACGVSWSVAGRSPHKLTEVLRMAGSADVPIIEVDLDEPITLRPLVEDCRVVVNALGPYSRFGTVVQESCAVTGTDYVDLCVDVEVLQAVIAGCDEVARASGARIVHSAGFLSLPFDLATAFAADYATSVLASPLSEIDVAITVHPDSPIASLGDVVSGGTMASTAAAIRRGGELVPLDARVLLPAPHDPVPYERTARQHRGTGKWLGPMPPAPHVNPVIVNRSVGSMPSLGVGPSFRYRDGLVSSGLMPGVPDSFTAAWIAGSQMFGSMIGMAPASIRNLVADSIEAFGPEAGSGPSAGRLDAWSWRLDCHGETESGKTFVFDVTGEGHLGYRSSANLVGESALLLATAENIAAAGVLTPAMAFGRDALTRFEPAGLTVSEVVTARA